MKITRIEDEPAFSRSWEDRLAEFQRYQDRVRERCLCKKGIAARQQIGEQEGESPFTPHVPGRRKEGK